jgi:hypothetical protein
VSGWGSLSGAAVLARAIGLVPRADRIDPDETAIRDALTRVYDRPEFSSKPSNFVAWLLEALERFFSWLGTLQGGAPVLFWLMVIGCIVLLVLMVGHITWTVARSIYVGRRPRVGSGAEQRRRLSDGFRARADSLADAGEFTEAVRLLFLSLVYAFDEAGRVPFRPALTNREYLLFFDDRPVIAGSLRVFVDLLDANWYGQRATEGSEYDDCRALFDRVTKER